MFGRVYITNTKFKIFYFYSTRYADGFYGFCDYTPEDARFNPLISQYSIVVSYGVGVF